MSDCDDIPPLEDMSPVVERVKAMTIAPEETEKKKVTNVAKKTETTKPTPKSQPSQKIFGGMQKGFLLSAPKKKAAPAATVRKVDYEIKNASKQSSLVLNDVQKAMANDKEWITEDILNKVSGDKKLLRQLSEPKFNHAMELMKRNPQEALERYKDDAEVAEFFKKFYGILGKHFTNLAASKQSQEVAEPHLISQEEKEVQNIVNNPELREILQKESIQTLVKTLKENPDQAQYMLRSGSMEFKDDVRKLVSAGVFNFQ